MIFRLGSIAVLSITLISLIMSSCRRNSRSLPIGAFSGYGETDKNTPDDGIYTEDDITPSESINGGGDEKVSDTSTAGTVQGAGDNMSSESSKTRTQIAGDNTSPPGGSDDTGGAEGLGIDTSYNEPSYPVLPIEDIFIRDWGNISDEEATVSAMALSRDIFLVSSEAYTYRILDDDYYAIDWKRVGVVKYLGFGFCEARGLRGETLVVGEVFESHGFYTAQLVEDCREVCFLLGQTLERDHIVCD